MPGYIRTRRLIECFFVSFSLFLVQLNQLAREGRASVAPVIIPALAPTLDESLKDDRTSGFALLSRQDQRSADG